MPKDHKHAHDVRNALNNVQLNLEVAQRLAARSTEARAEDLRQHLSVAMTELKKLKQLLDAATKE